MLCEAFDDYKDNDLDFLNAFLVKNTLYSSFGGLVS